MSRSRRLVVAILLASLLFGSCGDSSGAPETTAGSEQEPQEQRLPRSEPPGDAGPTPAELSSAESSARQGVNRFYRDVNGYYYRDAFSFLAPELQEAVGGYFEWKETYRDTFEIRVLDLAADAVEADVASVLTTFEWRQEVQPCFKNFVQTWNARWRVERINGVWRATDNTRSMISGEERPDCKPLGLPPLGSSSRPPDGDPACHLDYGGCLDPEAIDYDCIGGTGNGPAFTGPVPSLGSDPYDLDRDNDGTACDDF